MTITWTIFDTTVIRQLRPQHAHLGQTEALQVHSPSLIAWFSLPEWSTHRQVAEAGMSQTEHPQTQALLWRLFQVGTHYWLRCQICSTNKNKTSALDLKRYEQTKDCTGNFQVLMTESSIHLFYFIFHKALRGAHNHQIKGIAWEVRLSLHYLNFTLTGNIILRLGGLAGLADCYAVIVQANNATFLLAVNRMVAFHTHAANRPHFFG